VSLHNRHIVLPLAAALVASLLFGVAAADAAGVFDPDDIVFPVEGDVQFTDDYGDPRPGGRTHAGNDLIAVDGKGVPVVAVGAGTVSWIDSECCHLAIDHGGGWSSWYIHLDNDTPGTDDGLGYGIADGIVEGATVEAGQLIGWVGDSGNAEASVPHLHFELRFDGVAVNPYPYLTAALPGGVPGEQSPANTFIDDDGNVHEANIEIAAELGITKGCNPPANDRYCPDRSITRGQMAAFLRRLLELPDATSDYFEDDAGNIFEADINALTEAGIGFGCDETNYCVGTALRREEMAELLVRTFAPMDPDAYANDDADWFVDDDDSPYAESINRLRNAEVTVGCDAAAAEYCPLAPVTRAQMATFLARALGLE
jgi:hypothetical protein